MSLVLHRLSQPGAGMSRYPALCSVDRCVRTSRFRATIASRPVLQDPPPPVSGFVRPAELFVLCQRHAKEWRESWDRRGKAEPGSHGGWLGDPEDVVGRVRAGETTRQIAESLGVTQQAVNKRIVKAGHRVSDLQREAA